MGIRGCGVNIPLFSLRSKSGVGSGEFLDLISLIDWARDAGLKMIQLLPINESDEGGHPYSILSAFALNPIYINLHALAPELDREFARVASALNRPRFDYRGTYLAKREFLKLIFEFRKEKDLETKAFEQFFQRNEDHIKAYAAFCVLRDKFGTSDFHKWGKYAVYSELLVAEVCEKEPVDFFYFVQYHLDKQLKRAVSHAKEKGILLKGDFPMGVPPNSVEAWRFQEYFRWDLSTGAPPDFYNSYGQNWGFPPYNWDEIKEEGFYWLKSRLRWMNQYFDAVRLDHVLGYFRLWEIPITEVRGLMGTFYPSIGYSEEELRNIGIEDLDRLLQPYGEPLPKGLQTQREVEEKVDGAKEQDTLYTQIENRLFFNRNGAFHPRIDISSTESFRALSVLQQHVVLDLFKRYYLDNQEPLWKEKGLEKLKFMKSHTSMELFAEDIGVIPKCVEEVLRDLKIPNLYVQRMPKSFDVDIQDPKDFPEMCVCTPSNHDTSPLRLWWEEDEELRTKYYHTILKHEGTPPKKLTTELARWIVQAHIDSKARWAIFLFQDLIAMSEELRGPNPASERINDPADPNFAWDYRMHIYLEELHLDKCFTKLIRSMVKEGRR